MEFSKTDISGCYLIKPLSFNDARGTFVKTFNSKIFRDEGIDLNLREVFHTTSSAGVIRGMHFQAPPAHNYKIVTCILGRVLDVLLDIRKSSKTYGRSISFDLTPNSNFVLVPPGVAHGFAALGKENTLLYSTSREYDVRLDSGIHYDSFDFTWPSGNWTVSPRDSALPSIKDYNSPFE